MTDRQEPKTSEEAFARSMQAIDRLHDRERTLEADNVALKVAIREAKTDRDSLRRTLARLLPYLEGSTADAKGYVALARALLAKHPYKENPDADE